MEHGATDPIGRFSRDNRTLGVVVLRKIKAVASFTGATAFFVRLTGTQKN
jgi:hypothetical protein